MVLEYYKLQEQPFGVTPDARYLFQSRTHREAVAALLYGIDTGCGFITLIAAPGLGKTTVLRHALQQLRERARIVFLFKTIVGPLDLLRGLLIGLDVQDTDGSLGDLQLRLKEELIEQARQGKRVVLALDEAQNLDGLVLEAVRMLSNFETPREKLIQIILCGQPQLADRLASPEMEVLRQRVSIFSYLKPLSHEETELYIAHRLRIAGYNGEEPLFTREALAMIADCSNGVPRVINSLCFHALALGCVLKRTPIEGGVLRNILEDLDLKRQKLRPVLNGTVLSGTSSWRAAALPVLSAAYARNLRGRLTGWTPKFALGVAAFLAVAAVYVGGHRSFAPRTPAAHAESVRTTREGASAAAADHSTMEPSSDAVKTVTVKPGETLFAICLATFGRCDTELLQNLRRLNSGLGNPDHIEVGQQIRIPTWDAVLSLPDNAQGDTP
jgi:type II secretory pathway predicted ATPase ExeA